jgi:polysaccharide export outer membrane protein
MAVTTEKRTNMTHKHLPVWFVAAALLISFTAAGVAQVGTQQMPGSSNGISSYGSSPAGAAGQNRSEASVGVDGPGLKMVPEDFAKLPLAPGFLVSLTVLDDPDLVGAFRVDQNGDIAPPVLGTMHVAGKTVSEARVQIRNKLLEDQILKDPQVNLTVIEYTSPEVTVVGEVTVPGKYPLLTPRTLVDVLALAGGTTVTAGNEVQITRGSTNAEPITKSILVHYSRATDPDAVKQAIVNPGDTVLVKRAGIVYVLGAVTRPGGYVMQEEGTLNVLQAISLANGAALAAKTGEIHILRRDDRGAVTDIRLSYGKLTHGQSQEVQLHAQDVLYVPINKVKAVLTNGSSILAGTASASIYAVH